MSRLSVCHYCNRIHDSSYVCKEKEYVTKERMKSKKRINDYNNNNNEHDKMMLEIYQFRNSGAWKRKREEVRTRDLNVCRYCLVHDHVLTVDGLSTHHIVPLVDDFSLRLEDSNLITLCQFHHELAEKGLIDANELRVMVRKGIEI